MKHERLIYIQTSMDVKLHLDMIRLEVRKQIS